MEPITKIAEKAGIDDKYLEQYGKYKAKIDYNLLKESDAPDGKLILVTAINPTPAGEGKTTTTVGLADGMQKLGKKAEQCRMVGNNPLDDMSAQALGLDVYFVTDHIENEKNLPTDLYPQGTLADVLAWSQALPAL